MSSFLMWLAARDEPLGLEPVESPSAVSSEPNGLQVERLEAERLGRVGGRRTFHDLSAGEIPPEVGRGQDSPEGKP